MLRSGVGMTGGKKCSAKSWLGYGVLYQRRRALLTVNDTPDTRRERVLHERRQLWCWILLILLSDYIETTKTVRYASVTVTFVSSVSSSCLCVVLPSASRSAVCLLWRSNRSEYIPVNRSEKRLCSVAAKTVFSGKPMTSLVRSHGRASR